MSLPIIVVCLLVAGLVAFGLTLLVERHAVTLGLVAIPNHRSSHVRPTPSGGGIAIAMVTVLSAAMLCRWDVDLLAPLVAILASAVLGLADDLRDLPALLRFPVQALICIALLVSLPALPPLDLGLGLSLGGTWLLVGIAVVALWWINLFNFMDGIDGLAGSQAILALLGGAALWWFDDRTTSGAPMLILALLTAAATSGFLFRNWPPACIFMGDAGSYALAMAILAFGLHCVTAGHVSYQAWLILVSVLVTDATVTLLRRAVRGERPWHAHRRHAYQQLSSRWGHRRVTLAYGAISVLWALPLALAANVFTSLGWPLVAAAYAPLMVLAWRCGAGVSAEASVGA